MWDMRMVVKADEWVRGTHLGDRSLQRVTEILGEVEKKTWPRTNMLEQDDGIHDTFNGNEIAQTLGIPENLQMSISQGSSCMSASSPA